ncbi:MAG: hypothetical protein P1U42_10860 [Phycisphaerales bacterium]|nr:hypothetical protein [Phycisphaerales bacterium]
MIIVGIIVFIIGVLIFGFAWRGRVSEHGQFCKKCKFNLDGLSIDSADAICPECGRDIHHETSRRIKLRRRSRIGLVFASFTLILGIGIVTVGSAGKTSVIIAAMPDWIVIQLTEFGNNEALDELIVRTSLVPSMMSVSNWDHAIEAGLAIQADPSITWDLRWGQVLFDALNSNQMSDAQLEQYFTNGYQLELRVRDRVHPKSPKLPNSLILNQSRMGCITGGVTDYSFRYDITACRVEGSVPFFERELSDHRNYVRVFQDSAISSNSAWFNNLSEVFDKAPGEQIQLVFEYTTRLDQGDRLDPIFESKVQHRVAVRVIDPSKPIVRVVKNDEIAQSLFESTTISSFSIEKIPPEPRLKARRLSPTSIFIVEGMIPHYISLQFYLVLEGEEFKIGFASNETSKMNSFGGWLKIDSTPKNGLSQEQVVDIHSKLLEMDHVTVIAKTEVDRMLEKPSVDEIVGVNLIFEDVPVEIVETLNTTNPGFDARMKPTRFESFGDTP